MDVLRADDDPKQQHPGHGEVDREDPGDVVDGGLGRVVEQDQRDRRHAHQADQQQHRPAAQGRITGPVAHRHQR